MGTAVAVTIVSLVSLAGTSTEIMALSSQDIAIGNLRWDVDQNLKEVGDAVNWLKDSHRSLEEVVLQNCKGLNLLLIKEGRWILCSP